MNGLTRRVEDALRDGYLLSYAEPGDRLTTIWGGIAAAEGFPVVMVSPDTGGVVVTALAGDRWKEPQALIGEARRVMAAYRRTHQTGRVSQLEEGIGVMAGPFPASVAAALAHEVACVAGHTFPIEGYAEVLASLRKGEVA